MYNLLFVETEDQVFEGAEGFLLGVRLEDEEDGMLAGKILFLGLFGDADGNVGSGLIHIGLQGCLTNLLTALRLPGTIHHDLDGAVNTFGDEAQHKHQISRISQALGIEVEVLVAYDRAIGVVDHTISVIA